MMTVTISSLDKIQPDSLKCSRSIASDYGPELASGSASGSWLCTRKDFFLLQPQPSIPERLDEFLRRHRTQNVS
eukprot:2541902-Amphidinium_carterae.1